MVGSIAEGAVRRKTWFERTVNGGCDRAILQHAEFRESGVAQSGADDEAVIRPSGLGVESRVSSEVASQR